MQLGDRDDAVIQCRHLSKHVNAFALLDRAIDRGGFALAGCPVGDALQPFRRDPESPDILLVKFFTQGLSIQPRTA